MRPFRGLRVWQVAHEVTLDVWRLTHGFPREEQYVLVSQMRRAALSMPSNISEGCGLQTMPQLHKHAVIAAGSSSELEYHLLLSHELGYMDAETYAAMTEKLLELRRLLAGFAAWSQS